MKTPSTCDDVYGKFNGGSRGRGEQQAPLNLDRFFFVSHAFCINMIKNKDSSQIARDNMNTWSFHGLYKAFALKTETMWTIGAIHDATADGVKWKTHAVPKIPRVEKVDILKTT